MREITEQTETVDGEPIFWRSAPWDGTPTLYLHGVPTGSFDWIPFLERTGGVAPDLPGFGRSTKRGTREFTIDGQAEFVIFAEGSRRHEDSKFLLRLRELVAADKSQHVDSGQ